MPRYIDVINATHETATKVLALREGKSARDVVVTTNGGATASVSWSDKTPLVTLNMPGLPPDAVLTRGEADRLVAFIVHECCHVLHTNKGAWERACAAGDRVRHWTNCLEDIRIEAAEIKIGAFPAMRTLLGTMSNHLFVEALGKAAGMGVTIGQRVTDAPYVASVLGRVANGYAIPAAGNLTGAMTTDVAALVTHALAGVKRCRSTDAVRLLALELVRMEQAQAQDGPGAPGKAQDGQDGPGQDDEAQDGPGAPGEAQDGQDGPGQDDEAQDGPGAPGEAQDGQDGPGQDDEARDGPGAPGEAQDGQDGPGQDDEARDGPGAPGEAQDGQDGPGQDDEARDGPGAPGEAQDGQDGPGQDDEARDGPGAAGKNPGDGPPVVSGDTPDMTETLAKVAQRTGIDDLQRHAARSNAHKLATVRSLFTPGQDYHPASNPTTGAALTARLPRNSVLHGQIGRLLVSEEVHRRTHHETSGRLDRRALSRMRAGALDVFSRKDDTPGMDTALLVLIDGSSSMGLYASGQTRTTMITRMSIAQTAAWHVTRAAEAANAKVAVLAFHTRRDQAGARETGVLSGATLTVVKPFSVPVSDRASVLAGVMPHGFTPMAPAIIAAAGMLAEVNATRHILMVLTDGECDYGADGVTAACSLAEDMGVETVGIGMDCGSVTKAFPPRYSVNVTDLTQLASTGLGVLVTMLEDANPRGGGND